MYLARDVRLQRSVAVKALAGTSASGLKALGLEAWAMAGVAHPGVAGIHGIESWRGRPFLLIEYLAGGTLADRLRSGPVPEGEAVHTAAMVADALAAFHDTGCLHGDVKPSNIGFTAGGSPKLLDFGLARGAGSAAAGGTLRYASPGRSSPAGRPGRPKTSGRSASCSTRWSRASIPSTAGAPTRWPAGSGGGGSPAPGRRRERGRRRR